MAIKNYQWKASTRYNSTTTLSHGVSPDDPNWHTSTAETGSQSFSYWFRDANVAVGGAYSDANSSRVVVNVTDSWTASVDNRNNLTIKVTTVVNSIVRDDVVGSNTDLPGRYIDLYRYRGGELVARFTDTALASAHAISGPITLSEYTFTLPPGQDASRNSLFLHNEVIGIASWDEINLGIEFRNILPPDYRPGKVYDGGTWQSHNRAAGAANVRGSNWIEMRTENGPSGTGNPPLIRDLGGYHNMRQIGQE